MVNTVLSEETNTKTIKPLEFSNEASVTEHCEKNGGLKWVIYEGNVYDIEAYLPNHPGGSNAIEPYLGMCIDEPFEEQEHTKLAKSMFD